MSHIECRDVPGVQLRNQVEAVSNKMSARVLVVDDIPVNVRLLEASFRQNITMSLPLAAAGKRLRS